MNNRVKSTSLRLNLVNWHHHQYVDDIIYNSNWLNAIFISKYLNSLFCSYPGYNSRHLTTLNVFKRKYKKKKNHFLKSRVNYNKKIYDHKIFKLKNTKEKQARLNKLINKKKQNFIYEGFFLQKKKQEWLNNISANKKQYLKTIDANKSSYFLNRRFNIAKLIKNDNQQYSKFNNNKSIRKRLVTDKLIKGKKSDSKSRDKLLINKKKRLVTDKLIKGKKSDSKSYDELLIDKKKRFYFDNFIKIKKRYKKKHRKFTVDKQKRFHTNKFMNGQKQQVYNNSGKFTVDKQKRFNFLKSSFYRHQIDQDLLFKLTNINDKNSLNKLRVHIGKCKIIKKLNGLYIYFDYYFDYIFVNRFLFDCEKYVEEIFRRANLYLSKILKQNIYFIKNNIFSFLGDTLLLGKLTKRYAMTFRVEKRLKKFLNITSKRILLIKIYLFDKYKKFFITLSFFKKKINILKLSTIILYENYLFNTKYQFKKRLINNSLHNFYVKKKIKLINTHKEFMYDFIRKKNVYSDYRSFMRRIPIHIKRNKYFKKFGKIFFCFFTFKNCDMTILLNSISNELSILRRNHVLFFKFLSNMFTFFFTNPKKCYRIKGLTLIVKGRLILKTRQAPRKKKLVFKKGKNSQTTLSEKIMEENSVAISRFGKINIKLVINYHTVMTVNYKDVSNLTKSTKFLLLNIPNKQLHMYYKSLIYKFLNYRLLLEKKIKSISCRKKKLFIYKSNPLISFIKYTV